MAETAQEREARMAKAAAGRNRGEGAKPARRVGVARTKPVRVTVDMPPPLHRKFKDWLGAAAEDLDVADVKAAEVLRVLVARLVSSNAPDSRDDPEVRALVVHVLDELRSRMD
jgi:hypothetical protein